MHLVKPSEETETTQELKRRARAAVVELLELTASCRPELLDFQLDALVNSPVRYAVRDLASIMGVAREKIAITIYRACQDLDKQSATRRVRSDPTQVLDSPNVAALYHVCKARLSRTTGAKRGRLEINLRRLGKAYQLLKGRRWIEDFIGRPLPPAGSKAQPADR